MNILFIQDNSVPHLTVRSTIVKFGDHQSAEKFYNFVNKHESPVTLIGHLMQPTVITDIAVVMKWLVDLM